MKPIAVVRFPGTNCDQDVFKAVEKAGRKPQWVWHRDQFNWSDFDGAILPGGFSYGDYLRCGSMAAQSPVMKSVKSGALHGLPILGICNGFQILCESELLPGTLMKNHNLKFIDKWVSLRFEAQSPWSPKKSAVNLPVAHGEGCYFLSDAELKSLEDDQKVWCRYEENPNGSVSDIAGVCAGLNNNVAGLMPHPERAIEEWMGGDQGLSFFNM